MADYIVKDTELTSVANAIRTAGGTNSLLNFPNGFVSAVNNISGGSSDLTTAVMTVVGNVGNLELYGPFFYNDEEFPNYSQSYGIAYASDEPLYVVMYKGKAEIHIKNGAEYTVSCTGDATYDELSFVITMTGDCTVTISRRA